MRKLVVVVLVLVALGVGGDRLAAALVASEAERQLVSEGFTEPSVQLHGFPFLTQLAAREFSRVSVTGERLDAGEGRAREVSAELTDVSVPSTGPVAIGSLSARATVPYDVVVEAVGAASLMLAPGTDGRVQISRTVETAGQAFDVVAQARVQARGNRLRLVPTDLEITGGGSLDDRLAGVLSDRVAVIYPIPDLPDGVRVDQVTAGAEGFVVRVSARDVSVNRN